MCRRCREMNCLNEGERVSAPVEKKAAVPEMVAAK